jgi:hypothetical protein
MYNCSVSVSIKNKLKLRNKIRKIIISQEQILLFLEQIIEFPIQSQ